MSLMRQRWGWKSLRCCTSSTVRNFRSIRSAACWRIAAFSMRSIQAAIRNALPRTGSRRFGSSSRRGSLICSTDRLRIICNFGRYTWVDLCRTAFVVDDVADFAIVAQADRDHVVKFHAGMAGNLDGAAELHAWMPEDAVNSESPRLVAGHVIRHLVRGPSIRDRCAAIGILVR